MNPSRLSLAASFAALAALLALAGCTPPPACASGQLCGTVCANLQSDNQNCGACGNVCPAGQVCSNSACSASCAQGFSMCSAPRGDGGAQSFCADTRRDPLNCGECNRPCGSGQTCVNGTCQVSCPSPQSVCNSTCVDLQSDRANCGTCGNACSSGQVCQSASCVASCGSNLTSCGFGPSSFCANTASDPSNCGSCFRTCAPLANTARYCSAGNCAYACTGTFNDCDSQAANGCESNAATDQNNCGLCGNVCSALPNAQTSCANGRCGLGACNTGYGNCDALSSNGCETSLTTLGNCGACGSTCATPNATPSCSTGSCRISACATGYANCNNVTSDGCEVNTQTDSNNCGFCGNSCPTGQTCSGGTCSSATATTFRITSLGTTTCNLIEISAATGDDRGGIALTTSKVLLVGDSATGTANHDLSSPAASSAGVHYDGLFGDLSARRAYALGTSGGVFTFYTTSASVTFDRIYPIDPVTGAAGTAITLSQTIPVTTSGASSTSPGLYSGYGYALFHNGTRVYRIGLPSGAVTDLGAMTMPAHMASENWAYWGVSEYFGGSYYLVQTNSTYPATSISRYRVPDGTATTVGTFTSLSEMASFTFDVVQRRWYWHYESGGQFGGTDESLGYCDANFDQP